MIKILLVFAVVFILIKLFLITKHRYRIAYDSQTGVVKLKSYRSGKTIEANDFPEKEEKEVSRFQILHNTENKYRLLIGDKVEIHRECPKSFIFVGTGCVKRNICYQKAAGKFVADTSDRNKIIECAGHNLIKVVHNCGASGYINNRMYPCGYNNYCFLRRNGEKHVVSTLAYYQYAQCVDNLPEIRDCKYGKRQYFDVDYLTCIDLSPECLTVSKNSLPIFINVTLTKIIKCSVDSLGELSVKMSHLQKGLIDTFKKRKDCDSNDQTNSMMRPAYIPPLWVKSPAYTKCIDDTLAIEFCKPNCAYADTQVKPLSEYGVSHPAEVYLETPDMRCQTVFDENLQRCVPFRLDEHFKDGIPLIYKKPFDRYYHLPRYFLDLKDNSIKEENRFSNETDSQYAVLKYDGSQFELPTQEDNPEFQGAYGRDLEKKNIDVRYFSDGRIESRDLIKAEIVCRALFLAENPFRIVHVILHGTMTTCLYRVPININLEYETTIAKNKGKGGSEKCPKDKNTHFIIKDMCSDNKCTRVSFLLPTDSTYNEKSPYSRPDRKYNDEFTIGLSYNRFFVRCNRELTLSAYSSHENHPLSNFKTSLCKKYVGLRFFVEIYGCYFICINDTTAQIQNTAPSFKKTIMILNESTNEISTVTDTNLYNWMFFRRNRLE